MRFTTGDTVWDVCVWGTVIVLMSMVMSAAQYGDLYFTIITSLALVAELVLIWKTYVPLLRKVEVVNGGSDGQEDFVTVLFTANLLDYTVDDTTGDVVDGSATSPVKFAEEWSWARLTGTDNWLLEGIKVISE